MITRIFHCFLVGAIGLSIVGCDCGTPMTEDAGPGDDAGPLVCGDGVVHPAEACDDGNTTDGDGCNATCTSNETCGNGYMDPAEACDDGDAMNGGPCSGDCTSDYRCGNMIVDSIASGGNVDEACDDGNTANGDGCNATCTSDETCGNNVIDLGEACDDGNTQGGDDCSADCSVSALCGNGDIDAPEECDDGDNDSGDGCSLACLIELCGNGRTESPPEDCDDGNAVPGDGCEPTTCAFTCSSAGDCDDSEVCNGAEMCMDAGTSTSMCAPGVNADDGTGCSTATCTSGCSCRSGVCTRPGCGDGSLDGGEECDDGNLADGDGCDGDCTWTCESSAECSDGNPCTGTEFCAYPTTLMSECLPGSPLVQGASCGTGMICVAGSCVAARCGDTIITSPEQCDDGNTLSGDGCSATCTSESLGTTGFRIIDFELVSPRIVVNVSFGGCQDVTNNCPTVLMRCAADSINRSMELAILPVSAGGQYILHLTQLFRPLAPAAATTDGLMHMDAQCNEATDPDSCMPSASPNTAPTFLHNLSAGTCYTPILSDVNVRTGSPATYSPGVNSVSAPCFYSDETTITIRLLGIVIPLVRARISATYSPSPTGSIDQLVSGTLTGFMSETTAADIILPASLPLVGGQQLYTILQAGNRVVTNTSGVNVMDSCNLGGGPNEDDADLSVTPTDTTRGFWWFFNFTAERITWSEP